ncbi:MAG: sporulation protein YunB [Bacilli bacterium]
MKVKKFVLFLKITIYILIILLVINFVSGYFSSRVKLYIKQKATTTSSLIIANTINEEVLPSIDLNNLINTVSSDNENIDSIYINTYQVNKILSVTTQSISNKLNNLNDEELNNLALPLGLIISDVLFYDLGPNINIKIYPVGSVKCDVRSVIEEYGINNSVFRLEIEVRVAFAVVIPLQRDEIEVVSSIPIVVQIIQGEVPRYYFNSREGKFIPMPLD